MNKIRGPGLDGDDVLPRALGTHGELLHRGVRKVEDGDVRDGGITTGDGQHRTEERSLDQSNPGEQGGFYSHTTTSITHRLNSRLVL